MVPTRSIGMELDRRHFRNVKIWMRGVDRRQFKPHPRDHLSLPRPIVLCAGRLAVEKGIDDFIALKMAGSKVLVGDGPERERLQKLAPDAHFLGFRHGEDYARTLASADVMVFPSRTDTFGLVMLEAMACGQLPPTTHQARWTWWRTVSRARSPIRWRKPWRAHPCWTGTGSARVP